MRRDAAQNQAARRKEAPSLLHGKAAKSVLSKMVIEAKASFQSAEAADKQTQQPKKRCVPINDHRFGIREKGQHPIKVNC